LLLHFRFGEKAKPNPWQADTLEWALDNPPATYNFVSLPTVHSRHPMWDDPDLARRIHAGQEGLASVDHGRRETWGSDAVTGQVREIFHLPTNSWWPLLAAMALALVCIGLLTRVYYGALVGALLAALFLLRWSWENGGYPGSAPLTEPSSANVPLESRTNDGAGLWGMVVTMMANGTLFLSLLFGWFYLWTVAPLWATPDEPPLNLVLLLASGAVLSVAVGYFTRLAKRLAHGQDHRLETHLWLVVVLALIHLILLVWLWQRTPLAYTQLAHDALILVLLMYLLFHSTLATILTGLQALRVRFGYVSRLLPYEPQVLRIFWLYTLGIYWLGVAAFALLPLTWGAM
ncbi:MAG: cytochrome ubiquinol oxidase subunit I, partial [Natronospirillum sp.]